MVVGVDRWGTHPAKREFGPGSNAVMSHGCFAIPSKRYIKSSLIRFDYCFGLFNRPVHSRSTIVRGILCFAHNASVIAYVLLILHGALSLLQGRFISHSWASRIEDGSRPISDFSFAFLGSVFGSPTFLFGFSGDYSRSFNRIRCIWLTARS